jgi:hypothetical protein
MTPLKEPIEVGTSPGFMVIKAPQVGSRVISSDSMVIRTDSALTPSQTALNCTVHTDKTLRGKDYQQ